MEENEKRGKTLKNEQQWKSSQFNMYLGKIKNKYVIFNNVSLSMIEVKKNIYSRLRNNELDKICSETIKELENGCFVVRNEIDEVGKLIKIRDKLIDEKEHYFCLFLY